MERSTLTGPGTQQPAPRCVVVAEDQLALRRQAATLLAAQMDPAGQHLGIDSLDFPLESDLVVVACDVSRPDRLASLRRLRKRLRSARLVVVLPAGSGPVVRRAVEAGADGVVLEPDLEPALAVTVLAVAAGQAVVPRGLQGCLHRPAFSVRERQVLELVVAGLTNREIAARLFLAESTIKSHLSTCFERLGVRSRREAAAVLLDPDSGLAAAMPELVGGDGQLS